MSNVVKMFKENMSRYTIAIITVGIVIAFQILTNGMILRPMNITNLIIQNAYVIVLGVGQMLLVKAGGLCDMSVGSVCALSGGLCGLWIIKGGMNVYLALVLVFLVSVVVGLWNAILVAKIKISAYIATLASQLIVRGLTFFILQGKSYTLFPEKFTAWCTGYIPDFFGGEGLHITTIVIGIILSIIVVILQIRTRNEKKKYDVEVISLKMFVLLQLLIVGFIMVMSYALAVYYGAPKVLVIVGVIVVVYSFIVSKTVIGRHIIAVGGNRMAAVLSGVKDDRVIFGIYMNSAVIAAFAGVIYAARMNACSCNVGTGFEADAIAACYIGGGISSGSIIGAMLGALIIGLLNNGMSILGMASDVQMCVKGFVLVAAVTLDIMQSKKRR
ncbi:MAG: sugar ABC transporter permease [Eubacteriales bacterium]|nr:sugar ABC transporter permease [Eubacteriales bacterium]